MLITRLAPPAHPKAHSMPMASSSGIWLACAAYDVQPAQECCRRCGAQARPLLPSYCQVIDNRVPHQQIEG